MTLFDYGSSTSITSVSLTLIFLLFTIFLLKFIIWQISRQHMYKLANSMHKPPLKYAPFLGHGYHFIGDTEHIITTLLNGLDSPSPSAVWLGPMLFVYISRPEDLEKILNNPLAVNKSFSYNLLKDILGDGIFVTTGSKWKKHKKLIMPAFSQKVLDGFVDVVVRHINLSLEILDSRKGVTDFTNIMASCALDVVCEYVMGIEISTQKSYCKFVDYLQRIMDIFAYRIFNVWLHPNFIFYLTPMGYEQKKIVKYIQNYTKEVLTKKIEKIDLLRSEGKATPNKILLEILLEVNTNSTLLTEKEIIDEVNTFLIVGSDANATETNFVLLMLAMFPEIQQKVYEEVIEVLGTERDVEISDLPKMIYLERVIKETMRIFPIGPVVGRKAKGDIELENFTIPKEAEIAMVIINTHRNPKYFKDPLKFDPDRFLPEEVSKRHPYAYLPFTAGVRKCLGPKIAYMFMKTFVSKLVRKFTLETPYKSIEEVRLKESLVLKPVDGFLFELKRRF